MQLSVLRGWDTILFWAVTLSLTERVTEYLISRFVHRRKDKSPSTSGFQESLANRTFLNQAILKCAGSLRERLMPYRLDNQIVAHTSSISPSEIQHTSVL